jgi:transposase
MHLVKKVIKGSDYYYLVEKRRDGKRVRTSRTVYIGGWKKLAELVQGQIAGAFPTSFSAQEVGGSLALVDVACDLGIEELIDGVCPVRSGSTPIGRQILLMAVHRALSPRWANSKKNLEEVYAGSALAELLPLPEKAVDNRRLDETLSSLTTRQIEMIEKAIVERLIEREATRLDLPAFETTNFDSYAAAWEHLQTHVLGRTLLVSNRGDWSAERIVEASRQQADNERFFRDAKAPEGTSMLPLRHRGDAALRANALCVVLGLMLTKVLQRRLRLAGVKTASASSLLRSLRRVKRARLKLPDEAPPALRALAKVTWVPSERTARQAAILGALKLERRPELGATLISA